MTQQHTLATDTITLPDRDLGIWRWLISKGIANSITGLSRMVDHELCVNELDVNHMPDDSEELTDNHDKTVIGINLTITGDATGNLLIIHDSELVCNMIDCKTQLSPDSEKAPGEVELSFFEEIGNTAGAFFLNVLSDATNLNLLPSPPEVMMDTYRMIMDKVLKPMLVERDATFMVKAKFEDNRQLTKGTFFFIPTPDLVRMIVKNTKIT